MNQLQVPVEAFEGDLDLGTILGRTQAFGLIAGRCSAAQAACLREIRVRKLYKRRCPNWDQFCREHLHMARNQVHHIINLLNEFGPDYFELSQLTRVSPETYRAILPALENNTLHFEGEAIALIPANASKVSAAVAQLRKAAPPPAPAEPSDRERLAAADQHCSEILAELTDLVDDCQMPHQLTGILTSLQKRLARLQLML